MVAEPGLEREAVRAGRDAGAVRAKTGGQILARRRALGRVEVHPARVQRGLAGVGAGLPHHPRLGLGEVVRRVEPVGAKARDELGRSGGLGVAGPDAGVVGVRGEPLLERERVGAGGRVGDAVGVQAGDEIRRLVAGARVRAGGDREGRGDCRGSGRGRQDGEQLHTCDPSAAP
ncbi:MAG: hypothetical protein ACJ75S_04150 [Solirubrobacterales bacterium]